LFSSVFAFGQVSTVTTQAVSNIDYKTATGNGTITDLGASNPTAYGVCWNTAGSPTIADPHTNNGSTSSTGAYTSAMTGLIGNTAYKVRAYATNASGTSYGNEVTFTTSISASVIVDYEFENNLLDASGHGNNGTQSATWTATYATGLNNQGLNLNGGGWVIMPNNIIRNNTSCSISLDFKTSSTGTILGYQNYVAEDISTWGEFVPILTVCPADAKAPGSIGLLVGELWTSSGGLEIYSTTRVDNNQWHNVVLNATPTSISVYLDGIKLGEKIGTVAHLSMIYNQLGTGRTRTTDATLPFRRYSGLIDNFNISTNYLADVQTTAATSILSTSATLNGIVNSLGLPAATEYGFCWNTTGTPVTADNKISKGVPSATGNFLTALSGLAVNTNYYVRAYIVNSKGTSYGSEVSFTTLKAPVVTTQAASSIAATTATGNGNVTDLGVPNPTAHGVCWNTIGTPTTSDSKVNNGAKSSTGAFTGSMTLLTPGTLYYVRAYATNSAGTSYGSQVSFTTNPPAPTVSSFTPTSASNGTTVTITGTNFTGATAVSFGSTAATSFNVASATSITAVVAAGTSGSVSVTTPGGTITSAGFTFTKINQTVTFGALSAVTYGASSFTVSATGGASGNAVTFTSSAPTVATCTGVNGTTVTIIKAGSCNILADQAGNASYNAATQVSQALTINAKALTVTGSTITSKTYDGATTATITGATLSGVVGADVVTLGNATSGTFASATVGIGTSVTPAMTISGAASANYTLTQPTVTGTITVKSLSITGVTASNKVYDDATTATLTGGSLAGIVGADVVTLTAGTGTFADKNIGTAKIVTAVGYSIAGAGAGNYTISQPSGLTANITAAPLTILGVAATTKVYDGNITAALTGGSLTGIIGADEVTITAGNGTFADKNVGNAKEVTASGYAIAGADVANYTLSAQPAIAAADITAASLTITGVTASNKVYDAATTATLTVGTLNGIIGSDEVTYTAGTGTFADKNVGNAKEVTASGYAIAGADVANYTLSAQPAVAATDITAAALTATAENKTKVYGDVNPALTIVYSGFVNDETKTAITEPTAACAATTTSNVGSVDITLTGGTANNYMLTLVKGMLTISKAMLTATAENNTRKVGEANPAFTITYTGFKNTETDAVIDTKPVATSTANITSVAADYAITVAGGVDNNYSFNYVAATLTVTSTVGVLQNSVLKVKVYPNPFVNELFISAENLPANAVANLYDLNGRKLMNIRLNGQAVNLSHLTSGIYLLQVEGKSFRVVKQ